MTETPTQAAKRLCPAWQIPHCAPHYQAVLKALTDQRAAPPMPEEGLCAPNRIVREIVDRVPAPH